MGGGAYVVGLVGVVAVVAALAWGSGEVRRAVLPSWTGARAALAQTVVALAIGMAVARLAGAVGLLTGPVVLVAEVGAGLAIGLAARRWPPGPEAGGAGDDVGAGADDPSDGRPRAPGRAWWEWALGIGPVAVVVLQWAAHTADAVQRGIVHPDTLWYHGPFAARFAQTGGLGALDGVGYEAARSFPLDGQLVHALGILAFERDWLSPFVNLGWLALALLAAWCIGERRGAGPIALATASVVLGSPFLAATQPGQMSTDIGCAALLLAAVALALESDLRSAPLALGGTAAGLALGTKVTMAVPLAVLVVAVAAVAFTRRGLRPAVWWTGPAALFGSFWFLRDWVLTGSPLPWFRVPGLFDRQTVEGQGASLLADRDVSGEAWRTLYQPGLEQAMGRAWPAVLLLALVGATIAVQRGRTPLERVAAVLVPAGLAGHVATPLTGGVSFGFNLRYLAPALLVGAVLATLAVRPGVVGRAVLGAVAALLVVVGATAEHHERVEAWPDATPWGAVGLVVAVAVVAAVVAARRRHIPGPALAGVVAVLVLLAGWPIRSTFDDGRYVDAGLPPSDDIGEALRDVRDAEVVIYGSVETYALFGLDLSNDVDLGVNPPTGPGSDCERWRTHIGDVDVVVVARWGFQPLDVPEPDVFAGDPSATLLAGQGEAAVYRLTAPLDPSTCPV